jgi:hypothetical protein
MKVIEKDSAALSKTDVDDERDEAGPTATICPPSYANHGHCGLGLENGSSEAGGTCNGRQRPSVSW